MRRLLTALITASLCPPAVAAAAPVRAPDGLDRRQATTGTAARAARAPGGDPMLAQQWQLAAGEPLGAPDAWASSSGEGVVVAVVDSGVELRHPDLAANLWRNPGEVAGNRVDDDGNGFVDDVHGADVVDGDGDPRDGNGHGTHVAGIVAARAANGIGVAGLAGRARIMAVRVLDDDAAGDTAAVAEGLRYAIAMGARIVNLSLTGPRSAPDLVAAIEAAQRSGILVVAAAGNEGADLAQRPAYPASLSHDNVLGVAATRPGGALSAMSNRGPGADLAAPGESVLSTGSGGRYEWRTGTSMAAPHVSAALALVAATRPTLDWRDLRDAVLGAARPGVSAVQWGALDAAAALRTASGAATPAQGDPEARAAAKRKAAAAKRKAAAAKRKAAKRRAARKRRAAARRAAARRAARRAASLR